MADNVGYTPGSGASIAADDIGGVLHQRIKITVGADGVNGGDVSSSNPLPVTIQSAANPVDVNVLGTPSVIVDGSVDVTGSTVNANVTNTVSVQPAGNAVFSMQAVGELIECLEAMRQYQVSLNRTIGMLMPDTSGRLRILLDAISANLTLGTVSAVSLVNNQTQMGSQPAGEMVYGALHMGADSLRRNITVS